MADKKSKRAKQRKQRRRRNKGTKTVNVIGRSLNPIAQRYICKMKVARVLTVNPVGGGYSIAPINLNSIFNPFRQSVADPLKTQPYGRDTFDSLYSRYRVIGCKYMVSIVNGTEEYLTAVAVPTNSFPPAPATLSVVREMPRAKFIVQAPQAPLRILKGYVNLPSLTGRTVAQYMADDRYQSEFSTDPQEAMILNIYAGRFDEANFAENIYLNVTLEYTVELFDPKILPAS